MISYRQTNSPSENSSNSPGCRVAHNRPERSHAENEEAADLIEVPSAVTDFEHWRDPVVYSFEAEVLEAIRPNPKPGSCIDAAEVVLCASAACLDTACSSNLLADRFDRQGFPLQVCRLVAQQFSDSRP